MLKLNFTNPALISYYYPIIVLLIVILLLLEFVIYLLKNTQNDPNASMNNTLQEGVSYSSSFIRKKNTLKFRYLTGYILTRAAMWSKAPYMYTLYSTYHKFSMGEIGVLYIVDAVSAFIAGPITGGLADKYGRKLFSQFYNFLVISNLILRLTGNRPLAYVAQVLTGIGAGLIMTVFESWVVYEAGKEFGNRTIEKERFLKKLFKTQTILDAIMSIVISSMCAICYVYIFLILESLGAIRATFDIDWFQHSRNDSNSATLGRKQTSGNWQQFQQVFWRSFKRTKKERCFDCRNN